MKFKENSNRKFYNFETMFKSLKDDLRGFLQSQNIYYELSGCGAGWHFEAYCNAEEVTIINNWLDENTITEKRN